ncbi:MAG: hypothetical protein FJW66_09020 [Actinobacteria bacterium]|nr:hypothetical protein [Actinomycetota bacterium]
MEYQIEISGMHCRGCSSLIKLTMDEAGFDSTVIDHKSGIAIFKSGLPGVWQVEKMLDKVFSEIPGYFYKNIKVLS